MACGDIFDISNSGLWQLHGGSPGNGFKKKEVIIVS